MGWVIGNIAAGKGQAYRYLRGSMEAGPQGQSSNRRRWQGIGFDWTQLLNKLSGKADRIGQGQY